MATVTLKQLVKTYEPTAKGSGFTAVKGINLEVQNGEFMVLVGPSGCGKSTTLRMIAGLEDITGGSISIDGRIVNEVAPKDRDIAMVFQNYALYPHMSVFENMAFGLKLRKMAATEIKLRVEEAAALLGLGELLDRKPKALSGGQRQRVALGRAIVRQPKVFLFDEPLSNLDAKMRVAMRSEIAKLHGRLGATMIYVTHDQVEAMTMGDRICVMRDGIIEQVATPLELYHHPVNVYVAGFIGSPAMNLVRGQLTGRDGALHFVEAGQTQRGKFQGPALAFSCQRDEVRSATAGARDVIMGIRPENFSLQPGARSQAIEGLVELVEPMGAETHVHLRTLENTLIARIPGNVIPEVGEKMVMHLDAQHLHFFDAETGRVLA